MALKSVARTRALRDPSGALIDDGDSESADHLQCRPAYVVDSSRDAYDHDGRSYCPSDFRQFEAPGALTLSL